MKWKTARRLKRTSMALIGGGLIFQAGTCALDPFTQGTIGNDVVNLSLQIAVRQAATFVSDTLFFFLDNAIIRATT
jgi:hypothetical protein